MLFNLLILGSAFAGIFILIILSIIDLRTYLLPNVWVAPLALLGITFHFFDQFDTLSIEQVILGGICGYGTLFLVRAVGNWHYKQDSLGLGDVKLLGAGGLWLGAEGVFFAITAGAMAGLLHGILFALYIAHKTKEPINMRRLRIPAGPGFALGIAAVGIWQYHDLIVQSFQNLL